MCCGIKDLLIKYRVASDTAYEVSGPTTGRRQSVSRHSVNIRGGSASAGYDRETFERPIQSLFEPIVPS